MQGVADCPRRNAHGTRIGTDCRMDLQRRAVRRQPGPLHHACPGRVPPVEGLHCGAATGQAGRALCVPRQRQPVRGRLRPVLLFQIAVRIKAWLQIPARTLLLPAKQAVPMRRWSSRDVHTCGPYHPRRKARAHHHHVKGACRCHRPSGNSGARTRDGSP